MFVIRLRVCVLSTLNFATKKILTVVLGFLNFAQNYHFERSFNHFIFTFVFLVINKLQRKKCKLPKFLNCLFLLFTKIKSQFCKVEES